MRRAPAVGVPTGAELVEAQGLTGRSPRGVG
ncbi:conserved hypothetical protein [Streptomyces viridosporus ATCC 14672]|uniref:Uncharacterized protein n=1 Tax=Streptomyces viridosporus (strain ATCC 14672 / DSM 40746 / JCM 4963 / KCTC 9882 / NRRL B-12104 / FH 1290) TaxID=566461 RepID=D6A448_STRV1|nr:conserved hypothetical protein [Streptomyces viridosporus ATCC 14672]